MKICNGKLSLLLPAYCEAEHIYKNVIATAKAAEKFADDFEVIVIDDGSSDNTFLEAEKACLEDFRIKVIRYEENLGKGYALKVGTKAATGDYIAFCDADLEIHPEQIEGFFNIMNKENSDVVIGSKLHRDSDVEYPFIRRVYSRVYFLFLTILFNLRVADTQTGLKLFKASAIKPVMERILVKRYAFDVEVLAIINNKGGKITTAPVTIVFNRIGYGRIKIKDIYSMVNDTLAVFYRLKILKYYDKSNTALSEELELRILCKCDK